jgi:DNA-binding XRE family transcriptional regulator
MESTEVHAAWGQRIRKIRRENELTVTQVALEVGISRRYLHAIERGQYAPSEEVRVALAKAIGVKPGAIFNYDLLDAS